MLCDLRYVRLSLLQQLQQSLLFSVGSMESAVWTLGIKSDFHLSPHRRYKRFGHLDDRRPSRPPAKPLYIQYISYIVRVKPNNILKYSTSKNKSIKVQVDKRGRERSDTRGRDLSARDSIHSTTLGLIRIANRLVRQESLAHRPLRYNIFTSRDSLPRLQLCGRSPRDA